MTLKVLFAAATLVLGVLLGGCASAQVPMTPAQRERMESHAQDIIPPLIRGVAYDASTRRAYYSACERREYACDLHRVDLSATAPRAAAVYRSAEYGFVWPSLSPDGRTLAAVRVRRSERLSDRNENQDLVAIDLATGATRVLMNAHGGRFTRVEHLADGLIAVVRTYRSSPSFVCRGDLCTDRGEVLLWDRGAMTTLPMRTREIQSYVEFLPLLDRAVWVLGSVRTPEIDNPHAAYVLAGENLTGRRAFATWNEALDFVDREWGGVSGWDAAIVRNGAYRIEQLPFYRQLPLSLVILDQTHLLSSSMAVGLEKRLNGGFVFQVCENQRRIPWACNAIEFQGQ